MNIIKVQRESNMELCRIIAISLVVMVHSQFATFGIPQEFNYISILHIILQSVSIIGVNVFVLISGYYSIKLKKSSIINLLYICIFYGIINLFSQLYLGTFNIKSLFIISRSNWFIPYYLGLMLVSPILNTWIENTNKNSFRKILIALLIFECWFGFFPDVVQIPMFNSGCTITSFMILYLLARYYRLYGIPLFNKFNIGGYVFSTIIIALTSIFSLYLGFSSHGVNKPFDSDNPLVIFSALCFMIYFTKKKINYSPIINRLAKSTLAVLLIHASGVGHNFLKSIYLEIIKFNIPIYILLLFLTIFVIYMTCTILDEIRIKSFNYLYQKLEKYGISNTTL